MDLYFRRDCANILRATACASEGTASVALELLGGLDLDTKAQAAVLEAYRQGTRHALVSVGLGFGLEPVGPSVQPGASPPLAGLLWAEIPRE